MPRAFEVVRQLGEPAHLGMGGPHKTDPELHVSRPEFVEGRRFGRVSRWILVSRAEGYEGKWLACGTVVTFSRGDSRWEIDNEEDVPGGAFSQIMLTGGRCLREWSEIEEREARSREWVGTKRANLVHRRADLARIAAEVQALEREIGEWEATHADP